jgi:glycosyltransferase involved in cell wall biosynthesis
MRIIHVLNTTDRANGMICAAFDISSTQVKMGHDVYLCSGEDDGEGGIGPLFEQHGIKIFRVSQRRRPAVILMALIRFYKIFRQVEPDIVHAHMMTGAVLGFSLRPLFKYALVTTVHNEFQRSAVLMGLGNRVIAVSEAVRVSMEKRGTSKKKLRTVLNGTVNSARFPKPAPPAFLTQRPSVVFVGGLHPRKGVDYLIAAFAAVLLEVPQAHLYIVGDGPNRVDYERLALAISTDNIVFVGCVDDPRVYLRAADIFVLPSLAEPAALVISEAREAGCAIVASAVGGIPELLDHGEAGILVPPKRPDLLSTEIIKLCTHPSHLLNMRARASRNLGNLSVERVTMDTERVYRELR